MERPGYNGPHDDGPQDDGPQDDDAIVVGEYLYRGDAEVARAVLAGEGIVAVVRADDEGGLNPGFFSEYRVTLLVRRRDGAAARQALAVGEALVIPSQIQRAMVDHSQWAHPLEACGLIAGAGNVVGLVFCLTNRLASRTRYTIDPREHFGALRYAERQGLAILGAWHSHPNGSASLSAFDRDLSPGGSWVTVVVGNAAGRVPIRAYRTHDGEVEELAVVEE